MDRLNDIIRNSEGRRQILPGQRSYPDAHASQIPGPGATSRRGLPDETESDSEQRHSQGDPLISYPHTSNRGRHLSRQMQEEERNKANRSDQSAYGNSNEPTTNTDYPTYPSTMQPGPVLHSPLSQAVRRRPLDGTADYRPLQRTHQQPHQDQQNIQPLQPNPTSNYHPIHSSDVYGRGLQGDVVEGNAWEENGLVYGDWEEDGLNDYYAADNTADTPGGYHPPMSTPPHPTVDTEPTPRITLNLFDTGGSSARLNAPGQSSYHTTGQTRSHTNISSHQKVTQPLDPRLNALMRRERENLRTNARDAAFQRSNASIPPLPDSDSEQEHESAIEATPKLMVPAVCPKCRGAGYLRANVPYGHPNFGKPIACECKEAEKREKRRNQLLSMSNMDAFRDHRFETFNRRIPTVSNAYDRALAYAEEPVGWLVLVGPNGCGKTHLAASIANQLLDQGAVVLFEAVPDLLDHLRAAFAPTATEVYDQLFTKMREAEMLILDDLGAQQSSPWANEKLFQLLNYRYNLCMPTVITANQKGIQAVDERIRSRLSDNNLVVNITMDHASDYRPRNTGKERYFDF